MTAQLLRLTRITLYIGLTLPLMPVQALAVIFDLPLARHLPHAYHRWCCWILGFRLIVQGRPFDTGPVLYVANHTSYADIAIMSAAMKASFISKAEVAKWPFFGWLAKLQRSVFIERSQRTSTAGQRNAIVERLEQGDRLILFPEGTSSDGNRVLPFKSALFSAAEARPHGEPVPVQPVSVAYVRLDGIPIGRFYRPFFAWYGDMELGSHLWTLLALGTLTVEIKFHQPVTIDQFANRKEMSQHCYRLIGEGVAQSLGGRDGATATLRSNSRPAASPLKEPLRVS